MDSQKGQVKQTSSLENYLEAIVRLVEQEEPVTVTALSDMLGVRKPSVDWALKKLSHAGLVVHERYGPIYLTPEGTTRAQEIYRRHKLIFRFLTDILKVEPVTAEKEACRMEHTLGRNSIDRLAQFLDFVMHCHPGMSDWEEIFNRYIHNGENDSVIRDRFAPYTSQD